MKKAIRFINNFFIIAILLAFYFIVVGLAFLIYKMLHKEKVDMSSNWRQADDKVLNPDYFKSPY